MIAGSDRFKRFLGPQHGGKPTEPPEVTDNFDVGPRGICMVSEMGEVWCKGAIASPRKLPAASWVVVSPGENASACAATKDGRLLCWGEGYSPARARDRPVAIAFASLPPPPPNPNPAPIDVPATDKPWGKTCSIHRPCETVARTITACPVGTKGLSPESVAKLPGDGRVVSVQGPLRTGMGSMTLKGCSELDPVTRKPLPVKACCNFVGREIVVGEGASKGIVLDGIGCGGDESRVCCEVVVGGQTVVATGELVRDEDHSAGSQPAVRVRLAGEVKLCSLGKPAVTGSANQQPVRDGGAADR
jgi:hypothetical protein